MAFFMSCKTLVNEEFRINGELKYLSLPDSFSFMKVVKQSTFKTNRHKQNTMSFSNIFIYILRSPTGAIDL